MELSKIVANQVLIIFGLVVIGFILTKAKMLTEKGVKDLTNILLFVVTPCVLISSYQKEFSVSEAKKLGLAALLAIGIHIVAIVISSLVFIKNDDKKFNRINNFASVYSNCGFMAIPLLSEALGAQGVFYGSMYLAVFTPLYWTHGVYVYTGGDKKEISLKKAFLNPGLIGTTLSLVLFITGFWFKDYIPSVNIAVGTFKSVVSYMASLNTPLAMLVLGYYLANVNFLSCLKKPALYLVSILRLGVIPIIGIYIMKLLNVDMEIAKAIIIPAACPTATVTTLFASRFKLDAEYSAELVSATTLLSIITIPLVVMHI